MRRIRYLAKCYWQDRKGRIVIIMLLFLLCYFSNFYSVDGYVKCNGEKEPSSGNYICQTIVGIDEIDSDSDSIDIPQAWIIFFMSYILLNVGYVKTDINVRGSQYFLRIGSRRRWWIDKNILIFVATLVYFAIYFGLALIFGMLSGDISIYPVSEMWLNGVEVNDSTTVYWMLILDLIILLAISGIQMIAELLFNEMIALIVVGIYIFAGVFWKSPILLSNYTMLCRDMNYWNGIILALVIWSVSAFLGYYYQKIPQRK